MRLVIFILFTTIQLQAQTYAEVIGGITPKDKPAIGASLRYDFFKGIGAMVQYDVSKWDERTSFLITYHGPEQRTLGISLGIGPELTTKQRDARYFAGVTTSITHNSKAAVKYNINRRNNYISLSFILRMRLSKEKRKRWF